MENKHFDRLAEIIFDEQKIVTFKWLSKDLKISVHLAKQLLLKFYKENKSKNPKLTAVYCVNGILQQKDSEVQKICIIPEEKLANLKQTMKILSFHVYSIQLCQLQDTNSLYITDLDANLGPVFSIKCEIKTHQNETDAVSTSQTQIEKDVVNQDSKSHTKVEVKDENSIPKSTKSAANSQKIQNNTNKNKIATLFQNQTSKTPPQKKIETKQTPPQKKIETKPTDIAENKCNIVIEEAKENIKKVKENKLSSTQKKKLSKETEKKKINKRKIHEDEISEKKRKRIRVFDDDSSDSDEGNIEDNSFPPEEEEDPVPAKVKTLISDDIKEKEPLTKGPILQQKLISNTYEDEEGYLVTKKVYEMVEEPESLPQESSSEESPTAVVKEKEKTVERTNKLSLAQKTKKSSQQKQSNLMNYFKKS